MTIRPPRLPETLMSPEKAAHTLRTMSGMAMRKPLAWEIAAVIERLAEKAERVDTASVSQASAGEKFKFPDFDIA